jgi:hypothetical protein
MPAEMTSREDDLMIVGMSYSFGFEKNRNMFGLFAMGDYYQDRAGNFIAAGIDMLYGGNDYFIFTVDVYYVLNPGGASTFMYPIKAGIGLVHINADDMEFGNNIGYTCTAGAVDFMSKLGDKVYFTPYLNMSLDGTFTGRLEPRLEVIPAVSFTTNRNQSGSGDGYYYYYY